MSAQSHDRQRSWAASRLKRVLSDNPQRPAAIVIRSDGESQTYSADDLNYLAEEVRADLESLLSSIRTSARTGVVTFPARNDAVTLARVIACVSAGLSFLPVDPKAYAREWPRIRDATRARGHCIDLERKQVHETEAADWRAPDCLMMSGGSTGKPHLVSTDMLGQSERPVPNLLYRETLWRSGQVQLSLGPLWHAAPMAALLEGLLDEAVVVLVERFAPSLILQAIETHDIEWLHVTPTHMRLLQPYIRERSRPPRLRAVVHSGGPCPQHVKLSWIEYVGPERVFEYYGTTEAVGLTLIRGDEWIEHPGSVGRPFFTQVRIDWARTRGNPGPATVGEVFMRRAGSVRAFSSVGDFGRVDAFGYLYLEPRRSDMFIVGDSNVYPAEIEDLIASMESVIDVAVIAERHELLGHAPVAFVVAGSTSLTSAAVLDFCSSALTDHKVPTRVEFVSELPRAENGKLLRWQLIQSNASGTGHQNA